MSESSLPAVCAVTFALEAAENGTPMGKAVVCVDARYASALWRGDDRPSRLHLSAMEWRDVAAELELLSEGVFVNEKYTVARLVADGRAQLRCAAITDLQVEPFALTAVLDALLTGSPGQKQG